MGKEGERSRQRSHPLNFPAASLDVQGAEAGTNGEILDEQGMTEALRENVFPAVLGRNDWWGILLFKVNMRRFIVRTGILRHTNIGDIESVQKLGREHKRQKLVKGGGDHGSSFYRFHFLPQFCC